MSLRVLTLLGLLAAAWNVAHACWSDEFQCKNSRCIFDEYRCDGLTQCTDDSDEADCSPLPEVHLPSPGATRVRVQLAAKHRGVQLLTWRRNASASTNAIWLTGEKADGTLTYSTGSSCDSTGLRCLRFDGSHLQGGLPFAAGELELVLELGPKELRVHRPKRPNVTASVAVEAGFDMVSVGPLVRPTDMPVEIAVPGECFPDQFQCKNKAECIPRALRCNFAPNCGDGSDEKDCEGSPLCFGSPFKCRNGECIPDVHRRCDGKKNCGDWSDEVGCSGTGKCASYQFRCKNGGCIAKDFECDGQKDCADESDEHTACSERSTASLPAKSSVTATVGYDDANVGVILLLCNKKECSSLKLVGQTNEGELRYELRTRCDRNQTDSCTGIYKLVDDKSHYFPTGDIVLEVEHRPNELAVWRSGRPQDVVSVRAEDDYGTLLFKPWREGTYLRVKLPEVAACMSEGQFRCKSGACVREADKCDGVKDCPDGSDETDEHASCSVRQILAPYAAVTANVSYHDDHTGVVVLLCGQDECSAIKVVGEDKDGKLQYELRTRCDRKDTDNCSGPFKVVVDDKFHYFPTSKIVLEVERRSNLLAIWRRKHPENVVSVRVEDHYSTLLFKPRREGTPMRVKRSGIRASVCSSHQ